MKVVKSTVYLVLATVLLTFSSLAIALNAPVSADSRDRFVLAVFGAGLAFAGLALVALRRLHLTLKHAAT